MAIETQALLLAIIAALLRAGKRLCFKATNERLILLGASNVVGLVLAVLILPFIPAMNPQAFIYLGLSTIIYTGLVSFEIRAFRLNDLTFVEPVHTAIRMSCLFIFSLFLLDETVSIIEIIAFVGILVSCSVMIDFHSLRNIDYASRVRPCAIGAALAAALLVCDILGIRASGQPLTYIVWNLLMGIPVVLIALTVAHREIVGFMRQKWRNVTMMSLCDICYYGITIYILYIIEVGEVLPLMNIGTLISAALAIKYFGERVSKQRWGAIVAIVISVSLVQIY